MVDVATTADAEPWRARYRAHLAHRYSSGLQRYRTDYLPVATQATRPLVIAEALLAILVGFSLDDLGVLRFPGFLVGLAVGLFVFVFGGLLHGARWAHAVEGRTADAREAWLRRRRSMGRASLLVVSLGFLAWLVVFASGVPPWAA